MLPGKILSECDVSVHGSVLASFPEHTVPWTNTLGTQRYSANGGDFPFPFLALSA